MLQTLNALGLWTFFFFPASTNGIDYFVYQKDQTFFYFFFGIK